MGDLQRSNEYGRVGSMQFHQPCGNNGTNVYDPSTLEHFCSSSLWFKDERWDLDFFTKPVNLKKGGFTSGAWAPSGCCEKQFGLYSKLIQVERRKY